MKTVIWSIVLCLFLQLFEVSCQKCAPPSNPKGGKVRVRARGRIAKFRCYRRFTLYGSKIIICSSGKWNKEPPICIRSGCKKIVPAKGMKLTEDVKGAVNRFKCDAPMNLVGDKELTCNGKIWSGPVPTCEYVDPVDFCDFENDNLCGWQHDPTAEIQWIRNRGTTPTRRTGPSYDHTLGKDGNGHYMYMESSHPTNEGDSARLLSPFYGSATSGKCFRFWYHMYGQAGIGQVGRLTMYVEETGEPKTNMLSISSDQGDAWIEGNFKIGKREKPFRFVIEGTKMKSHLGDISVDDAEIYNCSEEFPITTEAEIESTVVLSTTQEAFPDGKSTQPIQSTQFSTKYSESTESTTSSPVETTTRKSDMITHTRKTTPTTKITTSKILTTSTWKPTTVMTSTEPNVETTRAVTLETTIKTTIVPTTEPMTTEEKETATIMTTRKPTTTTKPTTTPMTDKPIKTTVPTQPTTKPSKATVATEPTTSTLRPTTTTRLEKTTVKTAQETTYESTVKITTKPPTKRTTQGTEKTTKKTKKIPPSTSKEPPEISTDRGVTNSTITNKSLMLETTTVTPKTLDVMQTTESLKNSTDTRLSINQSNNITTVNSTDNKSETDVKRIHPHNLSDVSPVKPLMIGVGVGIAIGLIIVIGAIYIYMKKRRKEEIFEDEMEPIAKNAVYD